MWLPCGQIPPTSQTFTHIFTDLSETISFFPNCYLHKRLKKCPTIPTPGAFMQSGKITTTKETCPTHPFPAVTCPAGNEDKHGAIDQCPGLASFFALFKCGRFCSEMGMIFLSVNPDDNGFSKLTQWRNSYLGKNTVLQSQFPSAISSQVNMSCLLKVHWSSRFGRGCKNVTIFTMTLPRGINTHASGFVCRVKPECSWCLCFRNLRDETAK